MVQNCNHCGAFAFARPTQAGSVVDLFLIFRVRIPRVLDGTHFMPVPKIDHQCEIWKWTSILKPALAAGPAPIFLSRTFLHCSTANGYLVRAGVIYRFSVSVSFDPMLQVSASQHQMHYGFQVSTVGALL